MTRDVGTPTLAGLDGVAPRGGSSRTQKGLTLTNDAKDDATVSTVAFVVGGAALATGAVLWLTAPSGGVHVAPTVGRSFGGAVVGDTF